jgi:predicted AAA+ superfamily ATPase
LKRKAIDQLILWKKTTNRTPIILTGAKGVGKTYLAYDFARAFFEHIYYINFQHDINKKELFICQPESAIELIKQNFKINNETEAASGILVLDEIGYCEEVLTVINSSSFKKDFPFIVCISSRPLILGHIEQLPKIAVYPLEFDEFLRATGNEWYIELIETHYKNNSKLPDIVHKELLDLYLLYLEIGGMPGSINEYLNLTSPINVSEQHRVLWGAFRDCIVKDNTEGDSFKMLQVFDCIGHQLMKENKKFQYKLIRKGTTHSMYKESIEKLIDMNCIIRCNRISMEANEILDGHLDINKVFHEELGTSFKLYLLDTGLLFSRTAEEYDMGSNCHASRALLENYMAQSFQAKNYPFGFWESDSMAKIDFVLLQNDNIVPVEVFTEQNTRSKSLSVFKQKYDCTYSIKVSAKNFEYSGNTKYVPVYAVFCI